MIPRHAIALCAGIGALGACERPSGSALTDQLLAIGGAASPDPRDIDRARHQIDQIAARVTAVAGDSETDSNGDVPTALRRVLFTELGFSRGVDDDDTRYLLLPSVLGLRRGNCVGLGQVALAVAERLGEPLHGVLVPGHFFVRDGREPPRNFEMLRRGEVMPDAWYRERYPFPAGVPSYGLPLGDAEVVAVVHYNLGNAQRRAGDLDDALGNYTKAATLFADFAEAHASRGLVLQLRGELDAAARAYARARRINPGLPGLERNLAALAAERRAPPLSQNPPAAPQDQHQQQQPGAR